VGGTFCKAGRPFFCQNSNRVFEMSKAADAGRLLVFIVALLAGVPAAASAEWRSLRSEHFQVVGNASAGQLRDVVLRFEQFREVVTQLVPSAVRGGNAPVVIVVFPDQRSFEPFMPRVNGRVVPVAGAFHGASDVNYITLSLEAGDDAFPVIFHEYSHLLLAGVFANAPVWFNEGLAEYYSTLEITNGGRRAKIGKPIGAHVGLLRERRLRLPQLFAIAHDSKEYTRDSIEREILYAQSWAVVHHALHGDTNRRDALLTFARRLAAGDAVTDSLRETYGMSVDALDAEVQAYVRKQIYGYVEFDFAASVVTRVDAVSSPIDVPEVDAWLGDLLSHMHRDAEADARLQKALSARPDLARAHAALGMLRIRQQRDAEALVHLQKATALGADIDYAQFAYAYALTADDARNAERTALATAALERALTLRPGYPAAQQLLGFLYVSNRDYEKARALLAPMVKAAPTDHESVLLLAAALLGLNDVRGARALVGPLVARPPNESVANRARSLLGELAQMQTRREAAEAPQQGAARTPRTPQPPTDDGQATIRSSVNESPRPSGFIPALRQPGDGEQRVFGTFEEIECTRDGGIVLVVAAAAGPVRAEAPTFKAVQFITYRSPATGSVTCGAQPKVPALLTWRSQEKGPPQAVALELLPDGFAP
jgi:tetratricopeptide (TPR) repeat protein